MLQSLDHRALRRIPKRAHCQDATPLRRAASLRRCRLLGLQQQHANGRCRASRGRVRMGKLQGPPSATRPPGTDPTRHASPHAASGQPPAAAESRAQQLGAGTLLARSARLPRAPATCACMRSCPCLACKLLLDQFGHQFGHEVHGTSRHSVCAATWVGGSELGTHLLGRLATVVKRFATWRS